MSAIRRKLFGNRPSPANDAQHLSNQYEPDNETSEAWDASSNRRGGDAMLAMFQMTARTFDSKLAEPLLPAEPAPDAVLRFGPRARCGTGEPLLKRSTPAAPSSASPEFVQSSAGSATEDPGLPHRAGPWRLAGWGALGVGAPSLVVAIVMLSPAAAPVRPDFKGGMAVPPSAIAVSPATPSATSPMTTLASEAEADAERFMAEVERKMHALSAEVDRKMVALSAEMNALSEAQWYSNSPQQATPRRRGRRPSPFRPLRRPQLRP